MEGLAPKTSTENVINLKKKIKMFPFFLFLWRLKMLGNKAKQSKNTNTQKNHKKNVLALVIAALFKSFNFKFCFKGIWLYVDSRKVKRKYSDVVHVTEIKKGQQDKKYCNGYGKK